MIRRIKTKYLILAITLLSLSFLYLLTNFSFFYANSYPKKELCLVRKYKNSNMLFNFLKPSITEKLKVGNIIIHKDIELTDPSFYKKENYKSRLIGLPNDTIYINNSQVYINNNLLQENQYDLFFLFRISMQDSTDFTKLLADYDIVIDEIINNSKACNIITTDAIIEKIKQNEKIINIRKILEEENKGNYKIFPKQIYPWNKDNFGPIIIPKKGRLVQLNIYNIHLYKKIIDIYENHEFYISGDNIYIDNKLVNQYTFQNDYYFVLNDNRYSGQDSRHWGFIPENYIIGKSLY